MQRNELLHAPIKCEEHDLNWCLFAYDLLFERMTTGRSRES